MTEKDFYMTRNSPGGGAKSVRKDDDPEINQEIRALYEKYGEDGEIPEHILALAREIEEAHAGLKADGGRRTDGDAGEKDGED